MRHRCMGELAFCSIIQSGETCISGETSWKQTPFVSVVTIAVVASWHVQGVHFACCPLPLH